jgi:hypothetical protein
MTTFLNGEGPAWPSPPLLARLSGTPGRTPDPTEDPARA